MRATLHFPPRALRRRRCFTRAPYPPCQPLRPSSAVRCTRTGPPRASLFATPRARLLMSAAAVRPAWVKAWLRLGRARWALRDAAGAHAAFSRGAQCEGGAMLAGDVAVADDALRAAAHFALRSPPAAAVTTRHSLASLPWLSQEAARTARATPATLAGPPGMEALRRLAKRVDVPPHAFDFLEYHRLWLAEQAASPAQRATKSRA